MMAWLSGEVAEALEKNGYGSIDRKANVVYIDDGLLDALDDAQRLVYCRVRLDSFRSQIDDLEEQRDDLLDYVRVLERQTGTLQV